MSERYHLSSVRWKVMKLTCQACISRDFMHLSEVKNNPTSRKSAPKSLQRLQPESDDCPTTNAYRQPKSGTTPTAKEEFLHEGAPVEQIMLIEMPEHQVSEQSACRKHSSVHDFVSEAPGK